MVGVGLLSILLPGFWCLALVSSQYFLLYCFIFYTFYLSSCVSKQSLSLFPASTSLGDFNISCHSLAFDHLQFASKKTCHPAQGHSWKHLTPYNLSFSLTNLSTAISAHFLKRLSFHSYLTRVFLPYRRLASVNIK